MRLGRWAFRNVARGRARTIVTTVAMGFAGGVMIFYASLLEGFVDVIERNAVEMRIGDIQIHADGYRSDPDLYTIIADADRIVTDLDAKGYRATPRLYGFGLGATESNSGGVALMGVDLVREPTVTKLSSHLARGRWLSPDDPNGVVIGYRLARTLGAEPGVELVILSQAADGSMANALYTVRGVAKTVGGAIDGSGVLMSNDAFRELMGVYEGAHEIAVMRGGRRADLQAAEEEVAVIAGPGSETMSWRRIAPVVAQMIDSTNASLVFLLLIAYIAIGMVTFNAMMMTVYERMKEFGVMKALGFSPVNIIRLIMIEAMVEVTFASIIAVAIGVPFAYKYSVDGIDLTGFVGETLGSVGGVAFDPVWRCAVTTSSVTTPIITLAIVALLSVIWPAVKAARLDPVQAMTHR